MKTSQGKLLQAVEKTCLAVLKKAEETGSLEDPTPVLRLMDWLERHEEIPGDQLDAIWKELQTLKNKLSLNLAFRKPTGTTTGP